MLSPRRYSCDELRHTGAARYAAGRELPGGDVILPAGLASVVAAVEANSANDSFTFQASCSI